MAEGSALDVSGSLGLALASAAGAPSVIGAGSSAAVSSASFEQSFSLKSIASFMAAVRWLTKSFILAGSD